MTDAFLARRGFARRQRGRQVVSGLFFFPRGGSAQVARALGRALPQTGWEVTLAAGSLGQAGRADACADLLRRYRSGQRRLLARSAGRRERRAVSAVVRGSAGRARSRLRDVDDDEYERLVEVWVDALDRAGAARGGGASPPPSHPGQRGRASRLPGAAGGRAAARHRARACCAPRGRCAPAGWRFAESWQQRMRGWARACERLIVPPGAAADVARLLALPRRAIVELPSGVELDLFRRRPLDRRQRLAHWRRWLVEQPLGWDESGVPGSVAYHGRRPVAVAGGGGDPALRRPLHRRQAATAADPSARAGACAAPPAAAARAGRRQPRRVGGRAPAHGRPRRRQRASLPRRLAAPSASCRRR